MSKRAHKHYGCVTEFSLDVLGGKWKTIILVYLMEETTLRYGQLRKLLPRLSDKVLTQRLAELEAAGLIKRGRSRSAAAYTLSERGESLRGVLALLCDWGKKHAKAFGASYDNPLNRLKQQGRDQTA